MKRIDLDEIAAYVALLFAVLIVLGVIYAFAIDTRQTAANMSADAKSFGCTPKPFSFCYTETRP